MNQSLFLRSFKFSAQFDSCCVAHDKCYDAQAGKSKCDNIFCKCLQNAAKGTLFCKLDSKVFCETVKRFGHGAYKRAGKIFLR